MMSILKKIKKFLLKERDYREFLLRELPADSIGCELGVWKGEFSKEILQIVKPSYLYLVDPWLFQPEFPSSWYGGTAAKNQQDMNKIYNFVIDRFRNNNNVNILRMKTEELEKEIPDNHLDWVYIDGNHQYEYVLKDLRSFVSKVKDGGIICGDDYDRGSNEPYPITEAVNEFLKDSTCTFMWVKDHQFFLKKNPSK